LNSTLFDFRLTSHTEIPHAAISTGAHIATKTHQAELSSSPRGPSVRPAFRRASAVDGDCVGGAASGPLGAVEGITTGEEGDFVGVGESAFRGDFVGLRRGPVVGFGVAALGDSVGACGDVLGDL